MPQTIFFCNEKRSAPEYQRLNAFHFSNSKLGDFADCLQELLHLSNDRLNGFGIYVPQVWILSSRVADGFVPRSEKVPAGAMLVFIAALVAWFCFGQSWAFVDITIHWAMLSAGLLMGWALFIYVLAFGGRLHV